MFRVDVDLNSAVAQVDDLHKRQIPFAAKNALNKLAARVIEAEKEEMKAVFSNPIAWTLNSLFIRQYADKSNLLAIVDFKDGAGGRSAGKYLQAQIAGGGRQAKAVENFFVAHGLMPADHKIVPSDSVRLDRHGNITLSAFRAMVRGVGDGTHFALLKPHGKLVPGLYRRKKRKKKTRGSKPKVEALLIYVGKADYNKRLRYFETAKEVVAAEGRQIFAAELAAAIKTAR